jgi:hypothetical protein
MKHFLVGVSILLLGLAIGCSEESDPTPVESCETLINNFEAALTVYNSDPANKGKCMQVKDVGALLLDCPGLTPTQKTEYKNTIDGITCD